MEKELAKEQERNNRHRPPKIMEPPTSQEPPPKVGTWAECCRAKCLLACTPLTFLPPLPQPSRPRYKPPPQSNLLAPKLQFQVRLYAPSDPRGTQGLVPRKLCPELQSSELVAFGSQSHQVPAGPSASRTARCFGLSLVSASELQEWLLSQGRAVCKAPLLPLAMLPPSCLQCSSHSVISAPPSFWQRSRSPMCMHSRKERRFAAL